MASTDAGRSSRATVPRSSSSTTRRRSRPTASAWAASPLIERGRRRRGAAPAGRARRPGVPVFQFHVAFGEAEGGLGLWSNKVPKLAEITRRHRAGSRSTSGSRPVRRRDREEVAVGLRRHAAGRPAQRAARRHRDRHRLHDVGLRARDHRRRVLERLPDARSRGRAWATRRRGRTTRTCSTASGATARSRRPTPASSTCGAAPADEAAAARGRHDRRDRAVRRRARGAASTSPTSAPT